MNISFSTAIFTPLGTIFFDRLDTFKEAIASKSPPDLNALRKSYATATEFPDPEAHYWVVFASTSNAA